jgi:type II secretory pathway pseudopilin PulG
MSLARPRPARATGLPNRAAARCRALRPGFTIVELAYVMVLAAIVLGIALPRLDTSRSRTDAAVRSAQILMLSAQRASIQRQHDIVVAFDTVQNSLRVHHDRNNNGVIDAGETFNLLPIEGGVAFGRGPAPERMIGPLAVTFKRTQDGLPAVTFRRGGTAEFGGFYVRSQRAGSTQVYAFEVDRGSGRTTIFRYDGTAWVRAF